MPAKHSMPAKKTSSSRADKTVLLKKPSRVTSAIGPKATLIVAACVMAGGIIVAARQQSQQVLATTPRMDAVPMPEAAPKAAVASKASASPAPAAVPASAPVTITGCLERDGDGFRLKDTSGAEAPKSRSWKSGFLKKGSATIDLVDAAHTLKLADQVGSRVSVTGMLVDHDMQARSLHRVAASCSAK